MFTVNNICAYLGIKNHRHKDIDPNEKLYLNHKDEFESEITTMILQIILLLNAGLVLENAFEKMIVQNSNSKNVLYEIFRNLKKISSDTNTSFASQLYSFARRIGNKDILRFATLCIEHEGRGSELCTKLESERTLMWNSRLSMAKAKAKEAETKLCFPLMLLLVSLVIICTAPALMQM